VLRETDPQTTLWDALLPEEAKRLPAELARIDAFLDDERFIAPWRTLFDQRLGRPSVPIETLLRLLYSSTATAWATRACAGRWPTRSGGGGSAASRWTGRCRTRRRWSSWWVAPALRSSGSSIRRCSASWSPASCCAGASCGWTPPGGGRHRPSHRRRPVGEGGAQAGWAGAAGQGPRCGHPHRVPGPLRSAGRRLK
jgi:hypothetical protein